MQHAWGRSEMHTKSWFGKTIGCFGSKTSGQIDMSYQRSFHALFSMNLCKEKGGSMVFIRRGLPWKQLQGQDTANCRTNKLTVTETLRNQGQTINISLRLVLLVNSRLLINLSVLSLSKTFVATIHLLEHKRKIRIQITLHLIVKHSIMYLVKISHFKLIYCCAVLNS